MATRCWDHLGFTCLFADRVSRSCMLSSPREDRDQALQVCRDLHRMRVGVQTVVSMGPKSESYRTSSSVGSIRLNATRSSTLSAASSTSKSAWRILAGVIRSRASMIPTLFERSDCQPSVLTICLGRDALMSSNDTMPDALTPLFGRGFGTTVSTANTSSRSSNSMARAGLRSRKIVCCTSGAGSLF